MNIKMLSYRPGFTNVFLLISNDSFLLVDTGSRGEAGKIGRWIERSGYPINSLKYIFLTHSHYDHAGSLAELKAISGAKVIVHSAEATFLENGFMPIPKGTSLFFKFISKAGKIKPSIERRVAGFKPVKPDIVFEEELDLNLYGFDAKVIHTPGHTIGSSSLIFGDRALIGDCMFNMRGSIYPGFADEEDALKKTWQKILEWDVKWFYPAHGKRFSMETFRNAAVKKGLK